MAKLKLYAAVILSLMLITGCSSGNNGNTETETPIPQTSGPASETASPEPTMGSVKDYYPIKEDVRYVYEGAGNEYAPYEVYIDFTEESKVQQRRITGGTVLVEIIEIADDKVTRTFSQGETYHRENLLDKEGEKEEILLMEPLEAGTSWILKDLRARSITNISAEVTTPLGTIKAIEVTTQGDKDKTMDYYAKGMGLIKSVFVSGNTENSSTLAKIEENATFNQTINFYYPSGTDEKIYYKIKPVSFKTNDEAKKILETAYRESVGEDFGRVFTEKTKVNKLKLDKGIVTIDLSKEFISEMNAGALFEGKILQSLTNTLGHYYNAEKVMITVEGKPYESGHILMKENEFFKVKFEGTEQIK